MSPDPFNPYKETYVNPKGPGDARPTALQILQDNDRIGQWSDKVVLITGATNGIGIETARAIHATGADVFITARDSVRAEKAVKSILENSNGKGKIEVIEMHMESLESVKEAAKSFLSKSKKLNILINNAGIMAVPEGRSTEGFELQFAVNHLAHFTLTSLLLPTLIASSSPQFNSRVVFLSSSSHRYSKVHWDNYNLEGNYDGFIAYGQSKTANVWTANYIDRMYGPRGVHALSVHPGGIWTGLQAAAGEEKINEWKADPNVSPFMLSPEQGAATTIWAAAGNVWEGKGGKYLSDCSIAQPATNMDSALDPGVGEHAYDPESERRLWLLSEKLTGVTAV